MQFAESVRLSWRAIRGHRLRSIITTLGIVIGVAAVITFVTLGTSLQADVLAQVGDAQARDIYVWAGPEGEGGGPGAAAQPTFTERDVAEVGDLPGVASVVPRGLVPTAALTYRNDTVARNQLVATSPANFDGQSFAVGRPFEQGAREAVVNPQAARLFDENVSVGDRVTVELASGESVEVTVVGILEDSTGQGPFAGFGSQPQVYVPTDPFYETRVASPATGDRQRVYPTLTVTAEDPRTVEATQDRVRSYLQDESDAAALVPGGYEFAVQTNEDLLNQVRELLDTLTAFITGIAVISLVVGSLGIANVMLVSVTERTKEIGIMKAVGAQNRDVLQLFLVEATILGVLGAALGIPVGILGAWVATRYADLPLVLATEWIPIAIGVGIVVGIVAGLYPAWNAARVDPIDALRYE
jgi:putative ABC transport system permease protein